MSAFIEQLSMDLEIMSDVAWKNEVEFKATHKNILIIGTPTIFCASPEEFVKFEYYCAQFFWVSEDSRAAYTDEYRRTHVNGHLHICEDLTQFNTNQFDGVAIFTVENCKYFEGLWRVLKEGAPMVAAARYEGIRDAGRVGGMGLDRFAYNNQYHYWKGTHRKDASLHYQR